MGGGGGGGGGVFSCRRVYILFLGFDAVIVLIYF